MQKKYILISCFLTFSLGKIANALGDPRIANPLANLNYQEVSNLKHVHEKHLPLLKELGCDRNVIDLENTPKSASTFQDITKEIVKYEEECLAHLASIRSKTILRPIHEAATMIMLMGGVTAIYAMYLGMDSVGGSLGISSALFNGVFQLKEGVTAFLHLINQPANPVDGYEKKYVKNQCFIPRQLWPIIIEKLTMARNNPGEQMRALGFLEFTLGLTLYKQPSLDNLYPKKDKIISEILNRTNKFFKSYQEFTDEGHNMIKINIKSFLQDLMGTPKRPHFLYLKGKGGIGKTHFVNQLSEWINDAAPNLVSYVQEIITSPTELEGSEMHPGVLLKVLRNKCLKGSKGSIVFIDEANWINNPEFNGPAKRVFNGKFTSLPTNYLTQGRDNAQMLELPMPPLLVILVDNQDIQDENLRSRFEVIQFPDPKEETLLEYANQLLRRAKSNSIDPKKIKALTSFREVDRFVSLEKNK